MLFDFLDFAIKLAKFISETFKINLAALPIFKSPFLALYVFTLGRPFSFSRKIDREKAAFLHGFSPHFHIENSDAKKA